MTIREVVPEDAGALAEFFGGLPERDLTFIREDLADPDTVRAATAGGHLRWLQVDDDGIAGYVSVARLPGWSDHVGELRLVVRPSRRGSGVGRGLARHALAGALRAGMAKVVVELAAESESAIGMFSDLGFTGEALLRDHIRDRNGRLHDLVVLAHHVDEGWSALDAVGLIDVLAL